MGAERRRGRTTTGRVLAMLLAGTVLAACTGGSPVELDAAETTPEEPRLPAVTSYAALGDSFTSAPFVPTTDLAEGCFRSDGNYPALLAAELEPDRFLDVSCSAAQSGDVTGPQATAGGRGRVPPQLRAVRPDTDLVTVGIGANDENLFDELVTRCTGTDAAQSCTDELVQRSRETLARTRERVADVLRRVTRRAPEATVVLVGYPRLVDPGSSCSLIPVPDARRGDLAAVEEGLNQALRAAARAAGVTYADIHAASRGHEICSADPWVNGGLTDQERALAYHPFPSGQRAVAEHVLDLLREQAGT
jgi:lysophospholipase L1-like esterase